MINRLQKMKFTLHLDPLGNKADNYASKVLRKWADDLSAISKEEKSDMEMLYAADVHKQIYMSGLFLHLLSPTASKQLSNLVIEGQVNKQNLIKCLSIGDVTNEEELDDIDINPVDAPFSNDYLSEIKKEINSLKTSLTDHSITLSDANPESSLRSEEQLKELIELVRTINNPPNSSQSEAEQVEKLEKQVANQNQLIKDLINSVTAGGSTLPSQVKDMPLNDTNGSSGAVEVRDLNGEVKSRMKKVKKAKSKGVF